MNHSTRLKPKKDLPMTQAKPKLPIRGRWRIVSMTQWADDYIHAEAPAFLEFDMGGTGTFQFGYVRGVMDCRPTARDDEPSVQWTWEGTDEMDAVSGTGWAVLKGDELHGRIVFHGGDQAGFMAKRVKAKVRSKRG